MLNKILQFIATKLENQVSIEKIWENPSPSAEFTSQSLSIDTKGIQKLLIEYLPTSGGDTTENQFLDIGKKAYMTYFAKADTNNIVEIRTRAAVYNANNISFENAYSKSITSTTNYVQNVHCVPYRIYAVRGIK